MYPVFIHLRVLESFAAKMCVMMISANYDGEKNSQRTFTYSKSIIETVENGVKDVQS